MYHRFCAREAFLIFDPGLPGCTSESERLDAAVNEALAALGPSFKPCHVLPRLTTLEREWNEGCMKVSKDSDFAG